MSLTAAVQDFVVIAQCVNSNQLGFYPKDRDEQPCKDVNAKC